MFFSKVDWGSLSLSYSYSYSYSLAHLSNSKRIFPPHTHLLFCLSVFTSLLLSLNLHTSPFFLYYSLLTLSFSVFFQSGYVYVTSFLVFNGSPVTCSQFPLVCRCKSVCFSLFRSLLVESSFCLYPR